MTPNKSSPSEPMRSLYGRGSVYTIASAVQLAAALVVIPALTRLLTTSELGAVAAGLVVLQIGRELAALGLPGGITREYFEPGGRVGSLIVATGVLGAAVILTLVVAGPVWSEVFDDIDYIPVLLTAVLAAWPAAIVSAVQASCRAADRAKAFVTIALIATVGGQGLGIGALVVLEEEAASYLLGIGAGYALAAAAGLMFTRNQLSMSLDSSTLRRALAFGLPTIPHVLSLFVLAAGDRVVIERLEGLSELGRYHVAYAIGALGVVLLTAVNNAWAPIILGADDEERWSILSVTTSTIFRSGALVVGGLIIGAPVALRVVAPDSYDPTALLTVTGLVALSLIPYIAYLSNVHVLFQIRNTLPLAVITPLSAALNIGLNIGFVRAWGLSGAAFATILSYGFQALAVWAVARRAVAVPWDRRHVAESVVLTLSLGALGFLIPDTGFWLLVRSLLGVIILLELARTIARAVRRPNAGFESRPPEGR